MNIILDNENQDCLDVVPLPFGPLNGVRLVRWVFFVFCYISLLFKRQGILILIISIPIHLKFLVFWVFCIWERFYYLNNYNFLKKVNIFL